MRLELQEQFPVFLPEPLHVGALPLSDPRFDEFAALVFEVSAGCRHHGLDHLDRVGAPPQAIFPDSLLEHLSQITILSQQ